MMRSAMRAVIGLGGAVALATSIGCAETPKNDGWIDLFNGKDLAGWELRDPNRYNSWSVADGVLVNQPDPIKHGVDIYSTRKFDDFDLFVEFKVPPNSNSGVYLRGRYEIQILSHPGEPNKGSMGAIYGLHAPTENASNPWDQWQVFEAHLVGKDVTVKMNGKTIIDNKHLDSITGGTMEQFRNPDEPGPIMLQGDHGVVSFRKVRVKPIQSAKAERR